MQRLTTNKDVSEMSMIELAHNSCYAKDCKARYRDYDTDIDARELTIKLLDKFAGVPNEFTCDEDFDDFMLDSLQYGTDNIQGLIAIFYRNLWAMADLRERLKEYEDLEEQGKLPKLPCAVGDTVWHISDRVEKQGRKRVTIPFVDKGIVDSITVGCLMVPQITVCNDENIWTTFDCVEDFGKIVFLTEEEAEAALMNIGKDEQEK